MRHTVLWGREERACVFVRGHRRQSGQVIEAVCASLFATESNLCETTNSCIGIQEKQELWVFWLCIDYGLLRTSALDQQCDPHPSPSPFSVTFHPHPWLTRSVCVFVPLHLPRFAAERNQGQILLLGFSLRVGVNTCRDLLSKPA